MHHHELIDFLGHLATHTGLTKTSIHGNVGYAGPDGAKALYGISVESTAGGNWRIYDHHRQEQDTNWTDTYVIAQTSQANKTAREVMVELMENWSSQGYDYITSNPSIKLLFDKMDEYRQHKMKIPGELDFQNAPLYKPEPETNEPETDDNETDDAAPTMQLTKAQKTMLASNEIDTSVRTEFLSYIHETKIPIAQLAKDMGAPYVTAAKLMRGGQQFTIKTIGMLEGAMKRHLVFVPDHLRTENFGSHESIDELLGLMQKRIKSVLALKKIPCTTFGIEAELGSSWVTQLVTGHRTRTATIHKAAVYLGEPILVVNHTLTIPEKEEPTKNIEQLLPPATPALKGKAAERLMEDFNRNNQLYQPHSTMVAPPEPDMNPHRLVIMALQRHFSGAPVLRDEARYKIWCLDTIMLVIDEPEWSEVHIRRPGSGDGPIILPYANILRAAADSGENMRNYLANVLLGNLASKNPA